MNDFDSLWRGTRHGTLFEEAPRNDDETLRSYDFCPTQGSLKWRKMKRFLFPPSLLSVRSCKKEKKNVYESLSLSDITQQQIRANQSRVDGDVLKSYKRDASDGRKDWNLLVNRMFSADFAIEHPLRVERAFRLELPVLVERKFEFPFEGDGLYGQIFMNKRVQPIYGCTIAPIASNMWFDVEHIKNTFCDASASIEGTQMDAIITSRLGIEQSPSGTIANPMKRDVGEEWHDVFQESSVLRKKPSMSRESLVTTLDESFFLPQRATTSIGANYSDLSVYIEKQDDRLYPLHLKTALAECSHEILEIPRKSANMFDEIEDFQEDDLRGMNFFDLQIEQPVFEKDENRSSSFLASTLDVFSSMPNSLFHCMSVAHHWNVADVKNFSRSSVNNEIWHEGSKEMMSRCLPLRERRNLSIGEIFEAEYKSISTCVFPEVWEMVDSCPRNVKLDEDFEQLLRALEEEKVDEIVVDEVHLLGAYDPPASRTSFPKDMKILRKGVSIPEARGRETDIGFPSREQNPLPVIEKEKASHSLELRNESASQDYNLFDVLMEEEETGVDDDLNGFLGLLNKEAENPAKKRRADPLTQKLRMARNDGSSQESVEDLCLKVPSRILCRPWMLQLAQQCIQERHVSIYLPSPLSCLPSLCIILHTLLNKVDKDFRALLFCLGNPTLPASVEKYIRHNLSMDYSIDSFLRSTMPKNAAAREASAKSRIFVTDSMEAVEAEACKILFVLLDCTDDFNGKSRLAERVDLFVENSSAVKFASNYMNIVAPYQTNDSCADFHLHAVKLTRMLRIGKSIFCDTRFEEIAICLSLLKHESLVLVPSRTASNALQIIDEFAEPLVRSTLQSKRKPLKSIMPSVLESELAAAMNRNDSLLQQSLLALYTLRHARSYALYDGAIAALSYLQSSDDNPLCDLANVAMSLRREAEEEEMSEGRYHPIVVALRKLFVKEKEKMETEKRAVTSLSVCQTFSPLIITESEVMFSGILGGIENAVGYEAANAGDISLCLLQSLLRTNEEQFLKKIAHRHSHVIFIGEDRAGPDALGRLPPAVLNVWYAGAVRLVQVIVDEYRQMEQRILQGMSWYEKCHDRVLQLPETSEDFQGFMTTTLLCPAVEPLPTETIDEEVLDLIDSGAGPRKPVDASNRFRAPNKKLRFAESDVLGFRTDEEMRQAILQHPAWTQRSREGKVTLEVVVMNLGGNTVVTRIASVIAANKELQHGISLSITLC